MCCDSILERGAPRAHKLKSLREDVKALLHPDTPPWMLSWERTMERLVMSAQRKIPDESFQLVVGRLELSLILWVSPALGL